MKIDHHRVHHQNIALANVTITAIVAKLFPFLKFIDCPANNYCTEFGEKLLINKKQGEVDFCDTHLTLHWSGYSEICFFSHKILPM